MTINSNFYKWIVCSIKRGIWPPLLLFTIHMLAYFIFDIYNYFVSFDIPMHFLGGVCITYFFIQSVKCAKEYNLIGTPSPQVIILLIFLLTCTTTIFWEFAEWTMDNFLHTSTQVSLDDTLLDMLLGILGGVSMLLIYIRYNKEKYNNKSIEVHNV